MGSHDALVHYALVFDKCLLHKASRYQKDMATPGERLKTAREKAGYTSTGAAALALGVKQPTYAQHENGTRGFRAPKAELYARRFKVSVEWLLYGKATGALPSARGGDLSTSATLLLPVTLPSAERLTAMMRGMLATAGLQELADKHAETLAGLLPDALARSLAPLEIEDRAVVEPPARGPQRYAKDGPGHQQ